MAVHFKLWTPSLPVAMKVMVEVVSQTPCCFSECMTLLVMFGTLQENTGGCDGHVCVTEHETVITEPASTSTGTGVITGVSGEAVHVKHLINQNIVRQINISALFNKLENYYFLTFHDNKYTAVVESVSLFFFLGIKTEGPVVKWLDVVNLQRAVPAAQISY